MPGLKEEPTTPSPAPVQEYPYGGYGLYFTEMKRLHQLPGLAPELRERMLE